MRRSPQHSPPQSLLYSLLPYLAGLLATLIAWTLGSHTRRSLGNFLELPKSSESSEDTAPQHSQTKVSVILAARNEARNIRDCLDGLLNQSHENLEIIAADDDSSDVTLRVMRELAEHDPRIQVHAFTGGPPTGWAGKAWVTARAAEFASGDWLLFTDADIRFEHNAVCTALALAEELELDLLSSLARQTKPSLPWRLAVPPSAQLTLEWAGADGTGTRVQGSGHLMLVRREAYERAGGFDAIPTTTTDDMDLATLVRDSGGTVRGMFGHTLVHSEQWSQWGDLWRSFRKSYHGGTRGNGPLLVAVGGAAIALGLTPLWLSSKRNDPMLFTLGLSAWATQAWGRRAVDKVFGIPKFYGVLAPFGWLITGAIAFDAGARALLGIGSPWKGRKAPNSTQSTARAVAREPQPNRGFIGETAQHARSGAMPTRSTRAQPRPTTTPTTAPTTAPNQPQHQEATRE